MNEIASAFDLDILQIEAELSELIVSKQIQAKIDSHSKVRDKISDLFIVVVFKEG